MIFDPYKHFVKSSGITCIAMKNGVGKHPLKWNFDFLISFVQFWCFFGIKNLLLRKGTGDKISWKPFIYQALADSSTATAQATVAPTIGLLPSIKVNPNCSLFNINCAQVADKRLNCNRIFPVLSLCFVCFAANFYVSCGRDVDEMWTRTVCDMVFVTC